MSAATAHTAYAPNPPCSVALSGDGSTLAVGATDEGSEAVGVDGEQSDESFRGAGAAYIFQRDPRSVSSQRTYVKPSNTAGNGIPDDVFFQDDFWFGWSVGKVRIHRPATPASRAIRYTTSVAPPSKARFARMLARVRRASEAVRRGVVVALLGLVYGLVLPWFAVGLRLRRRRSVGFRPRQDLAIATLERLRMPH